MINGEFVLYCKTYAARLTTMVSRGIGEIKKGITGLLRMSRIRRDERNPGSCTQSVLKITQNFTFVIVVQKQPAAGIIIAGCSHRLQPGAGIFKAIKPLVADDRED
ncbi:hypothetical protein [Fodinibius sediminis]|uniref:hypothetical protein n=1 Tax=Fodinibius sediminis TaxID=1214077 RepID=UPI0011579E28|nr:hypothetical protein [Fodinibius sediminis]